MAEWLIDTLPQTDKPVLFIDDAGETGNSFYIIGKVAKAYTAMGRLDILEEYIHRATSGKSDLLIAVTKQYTQYIKWLNSTDSNPDILPETEQEKIALHLLGLQTVERFQQRQERNV